MTKQEFEDLRMRSEGDTLDFKAMQYDFSGTDEEKTKKRSMFVKDILCLANTPRECTAYIVLGIKCHPDGTKEFTGISEHIDDADFQSKVNEWIYPHPRFTYEAIQHEGKAYGVISIPVVQEIGPYYYVGEEKNNILLRNQIYLRRSSQNATASQAEKKVVYKWFIESPRQQIAAPQINSQSPWDAFLQSVDNFDKRRSFILLLSPLDQDLPPPDLAALGTIDWFFVADFDPASSNSGSLSACRKTIELRRGLHVMTKGDFSSFSPRNATYWYLPRGMADRNDTLTSTKWIEWHRAYSQDIATKVCELAKAIPRPITIVVAWYSNDLMKHLNTFMESILAPLGNGVEVSFVSANGDIFASIANEYDATVVQIPLHHLIGGLKQLATIQRGETNAVVIPSNSGTNIEIEAKMIGWMQEEMEIIHPNLGLRPPAGANGSNEFLRGNPVSWFDLALHVDVERDLQAKLVKVVQGNLQKRRCARVNLYHEPGAGGSTLAMRVVWNLRLDYPCVVLHRCIPKQTVEKLQMLFSRSGSPLVVLSEGNCLSDQQSDELATLLASRNIPAVVLQVLRRFEKPRMLKENSLHLEAVLTEGERYRFENILIRDAPQRAGAIRTAVASASDVEKTPFYLGLVAFENDFVSIEAHIARHIEQLNNTQRQALTFLSIAHFYGQRPLDAQLFSKLFCLPPSKPVEFDKVFGEYALRLLVKTDANNWRPLHHLISAELLEQILSIGIDDRRLWRTQLTDVALSFIEFCADCNGKIWDAVTDLLQRVFIYRDDTEFLGTEQAGGKRFSRIIMDIPADEGRLHVFKRLTEVYPEEHHYWAHLGRFYANQLKEHAKAIEAIDQALSLCDDDHLIHHMKGMVLRNWAYDRMRDSAPLDDVLALANRASECFRAARELSPSDDHGFISEIQLITRILEYGAKITGKTAVLAAASHPSRWLREGFDVAENLLEEVRRKRQTDAESEYESRCRADLNVLYGQHGMALQTWQNLLDRRTGYAPPIRRQIIRTLLNRHNQRWGDMSDHELQRSLGLLQLNITEEPNDGRNIRLWLQAIRASNKTVALEDVIEKVSYWATVTDSLESHYYLYVLYSLLAIEGSALAASKAEPELEKCRSQAKYRRDRTKSHEWLGLAQGLKALVQQEALGQWNRQENFWQDAHLLRRVSGVITQIRGQEAGTIEVAGMKAFFVPGVSGHYFMVSENQSVTFFLGFSYDGLRAWSVRDA